MVSAMVRRVFGHSAIETMRHSSGERSAIDTGFGRVRWDGASARGGTSSPKKPGMGLACDMVTTYRHNG